VPRIGPGELLVRVEASGICGSDVMEWYRVHRAPLILGHEVGGVIVQVGEGVERYREGDRVAVYHHVPCNCCRHCVGGHPTVCDTFRKTHFDPGGFAEYIRVRAINVAEGVYPLTEEMTFEDGSFVEPVACAVHALRAARLQPGQSVLVIGSGISGILLMQVAIAFGAGRVMATDISEYRMKAALRFGAEAVFNAGEDVPARVREVNGGRLADQVLVCAGAVSAVIQAIQSVERGGTVLLFAPTKPGETVPLPVADIWANEVTIGTCYGGSPSDATIAFELIRAGRLKVREMVTHRLSLDEIGLGFKLVAAGGESLKVIIEPQR